MKILKTLNKYYKVLLFLLLLTLFLHLKLPFYIYKDGGTVNLNDRISLNNENIEGSFNMSYVGVIKGTPFFITLSKVISSWDLVSDNELIPDGMDRAEKKEYDLLQTDLSKKTATYVAYTKAGKDIAVQEEKILVSYVDKLAVTDLKISDELININGIEFYNFVDINKYIKTLPVDEDIKILVKRQNQEFMTTSKLTEYEKDLYLIGVSFIKILEIDTDPKIEINFKKSELGPSAGLMLTLAIYNSLIDEDLTKGKIISGTGTIDEAGNVGKIGGLKYKMLGSKKSDVFLVPESQILEANSIMEKYKLEFELIGVNTFDEALEYLNKL